MPITNLLILTLQCESLFCEYRISSINSRGYYSFLIVKSAASIRGRLLIKGGYYYKIPKKLREIVPELYNFRLIITILVQNVELWPLFEGGYYSLQKA